MSTITTQRTTTATRVGQVLTILATLFLLFDAVSHIVKPAQVVASFQQLGFPIGIAAVIGVLELVFVVLYVVPRTSVLGAILLTGYLGGAVCAQVRIGAPFFSTQLSAVYVAVFVWAGVYLRNAALRKALGVDILS
jgi:hypothetical protein